MKYVAVVILASICFAGLVTSKSHRDVRDNKDNLINQLKQNDPDASYHGHVSDPDNGDGDGDMYEYQDPDNPSDNSHLRHSQHGTGDNDETENDNNRVNDYPRKSHPQQCGANVESCARPLIRKYYTGDPLDLLAIPLRVRLSGARAICSDGLEFGRCVKEELDKPVCKPGNLPDFWITRLQDSWTLAQKLCIERIDDFAKHWHCLLSLRVLSTKLIKCDPYDNGPRGCNVTKTVDCLANAYARVPDCEAGATDFIREFLPQVMNLAEVCPSYGPYGPGGPGGYGGPGGPDGSGGPRGPGGPMFSRSLQEFLKIK